jgi:hypothetical protein
MRKLFVIAAMLLVSACRVSLDGTVGFDNGCSSSNGHQSSGCSTGHNPGVIVIVIAPTRVYADAADALCYQLNPTPASVTTSGSYAFQNNTSSSVTIVGSNQVPWVTVGPGETSTSLSYSTAGVYGFGVQGCRGVGGTAMYGVLNVTLN